MKSLSNKEADVVREFVFQIQHGDQEHRNWLVEAGEQFIKGEPVPPVKGGKPSLPPTIPTSGFIADA